MPAVSPPAKISNFILYMLFRLKFVTQEDDFEETIDLMKLFFAEVRKGSPGESLKYYCFIHKLDGDMYMDEDGKAETQSIIQNGVKMAFNTWDDEMNISFYQTR